MTKRELVIEVAKQLGFTQNDVARVFETRKRGARMGRNPRTGEEVPIPEKRVATFKPGKLVKEKVENSHPEPDLFAQ